MDIDEFNEIAFYPGGTRPVMSRPPELIATNRFIFMVERGFEEHTTASTRADWILNLMERYGAASAQPVFTMDGQGPCCSWCGAIWPLCGHHHMSTAIPKECVMCGCTDDAACDPPCSWIHGEGEKPLCSACAPDNQSR